MSAAPRRQRTVPQHAAHALRLLLAGRAVVVDVLSRAA